MILPKKKLDYKCLVCNHIYEKYRENSGQFLHPLLIKLVMHIRDNMTGGILVVNIPSSDYDPVLRFVGTAGTVEIRDDLGLRCNLCTPTKHATNENEASADSHLRGRALDLRIISDSSYKYVMSSAVIRILDELLSVTKEYQGKYYMKDLGKGLVHFEIFE